MNVKTRVLLIGGVLGALLGVLAGWLYFNSVPVQTDEEGKEHVPAPSAGDALKLSLGVLGVLRSISG
ncbi:MAG: hypothetical protein JXB35_04030 [Anaerolineae bacterium]|nr:hypothetical protein [Anaerolineae bacterium]